MTFASRAAAQMPERLLVRLISLVYGRFEPEIRRLDEVCGRGGTMLDIGGWYGPWARRLVGRAAPRARKQDERPRAAPQDHSPLDRPSRGMDFGLQGAEAGRR